MTGKPVEALRGRIASLVAELYPNKASETLDGLMSVVERWAPALGSTKRGRPDESTTYLITYGDGFRRTGEPPLRTLASVLRRHVRDVVTDVHLLPIYPWTSDDGFGVVDHRAVNAALGDWDDVADLRAEYALALDFVANHVSSSSAWFRGWLADDPRFAGYFLEPDPAFDVSRVVRPRSAPLMHTYLRTDGREVRAWTTFGPDQVDIDPSTPGVLFDLTDVLLGYLARGANTVRLDAIGYLWKESGTTCIHLPQTHAIIRIWRAIVDTVAPGALLLTETNVPHADNITYLGDGSNEANMVYQFALPPLVLHAFVTGRATALTQWASSIGPVSSSATWFNFLASHDGIGIRPTEGLLSDEDRARLVERTLAHGGQVSMARRPDGSEGVYELNTNYLDALVAPGDPNHDASAVIRGLAAHVILLSVVGVPAIYYHSLFGSGQDREGMLASGVARRINRQVLDADLLDDQVTSSPRRSGMLEGLRAILSVRRTLRGFSPFASQSVEPMDDRVFAIRRAQGTDHEVLALVNVSDQLVRLTGLSGTDALTGFRYNDGVELAPFAYVWLVDSSR